MNSLKYTDVVCIIIILVVVLLQSREVIHNVKKAQKYDDNLSKAYIFAIVIPLAVISNHRIMVYVTLLYGLMIIMLLTCIFVFYLVKRKEEDKKYIKKHLMIIVFVFVTILFIEYLITFN